jgi:hypothetical protein
MTAGVLQKEPRWIGPYEVLGCLGRGGTGAVYKARHALTGSLVAVKVLAAEAADNPVALRRFEREFRTAQGLDHPHIVRGLDFGQEGETPFRGRGYMDTVRLKLARQLVSPRQLAPALSRRSERVILWALNESPAQRPASCLELLAELTSQDGASAAQVGPAVMPAWSGPERRASVRRSCRRPSLCLPLDSEGQTPWEAELRNVSAGGLCVVLGRRVEPGTMLLVEWQEAARGAPAALVARVVHAQPQGPGRWSLGCRLARALGDAEVLALV